MSEMKRNKFPPSLSHGIFVLMICRKKCINYSNFIFNFKIPTLKVNKNKEIKKILHITFMFMLQ